ncbi:MAG: hypothetical protein GY866_36945 [Proteobacteria bacterium]|nr:hypothetical protein [Pseudomonadota bacterium]
MTLEFNIIYTKGTVGPLSFFVWSLLKWSDCSFRLVSNGCLAPEERFLRRLCDQNNRLEYWTIPTKSCLPHGQVLNYLQTMTRSDFFCFMDSDIFATSDFESRLTGFLKEHTGIFSCAPIWITANDAILPESFRIMSGTHNRSENGVCLGGTFFAIYDNHALTNFIQETGIGFNGYRWSEIPPQFREELSSIRIVKDVYDTGKLLNLLLTNRDHKLIYENSPALCHIGGISFIPLKNNSSRGRKASFVRRITNSRFKPLIQPVLEKYRARTAFKAYRSYSPAEFQAIVTQRRHQRDPTRNYIFRFLHSLFDGTPLPETIETGNREIDARIKTATEHIVELYREYEHMNGASGPKSDQTDW